MMPRGSTITPLPETRLNEPPRTLVQMMLTSAARVFRLTSSKENSGAGAVVDAFTVESSGARGDIGVANAAYVSCASSGGGKKKALSLFRVRCPAKPVPPGRSEEHTPETQ